MIEQPSPWTAERLLISNGGSLLAESFPDLANSLCHKANLVRLAMWFAHLRSGLYPQARKQLSSRAGDCCLGVACKVAWSGQPGLFNASVDPDDGEVTYAGEGEVLPKVVADWFGFVDTNPGVLIGHYSRQASSLNDANGLTLSEIADVFEAFYIHHDMRRLPKSLVGKVLGNEGVSGADFI